MLSLRGCTQEEIRKMIPETTVLLGYRGSISHGMYVNPDQPDSIDDKDLLGVCFAPLSTYVGALTKPFEQKETFLREWDVVVYEYRKFVRLLAGANPNVLGLLWLEPNHYLSVSASGKRLIEHRDLFSSKRIFHSFTGYAHGQLKRMTHLAFKGYMGEKRKRLVEQYGYDTKNAAHLIRLLRMGIEFLREGQLHVLRPDAKQLMEIKQGHWTLERVQEEAKHLFRRAEAAYDTCRLPSEPDKHAIERLVVEEVMEYLREI